MKKNAMLKIAAILMVAVLLTTCAISSTFAKYTTTAATKDVKARVAKWGVELETSLEGLFDTVYAAIPASQYNPVGVADDGDKTNTVISSTTMNLMAPGTSGQTKALSTVKGTPEVAVRVVNELELNLSGWVDDYCPIVFTVNSTPYSVATIDNDEYQASGKTTKLDYLEYLVESAVAATSVDYAPNTDLSKQDAFAVVISWDWSYDSTDNDEYDNKIGNAAANATEQEKIAAVEIKFTQSITQID